MIRVRWFPASWLLIQGEGSVIYVDPAYIRSYFDSYPSRVDYSRWPDPIDGLPEEHLPLADAILVSHAHKDHCKAVTVRRLSDHHTEVFAPARCRRELDEGFTLVEEGDSFRAAGFAVTAVPAYNTTSGRSTRKQHKRRDGAGYVLQGKDGAAIYHAGDTDALPEMAELPKPALAFLPVGGTFTMDAREAAKAAALIEPGCAIPMHYRDPAQAQEFAALVERQGGASKVLSIGETIEIP